jgi:DNA-binding SARP family transcriptional activator
MLGVSLLGDFSIRHDEAPVTDVDTPRLQSLLAFLMLHRDAPQSRAHLAFLFWPDTTEAQARTNLRYLLHHLRRALPEADTYLVTSVQTLQWRPDAVFALDVADFEAALAQAAQAPQASDSPAAREALERAIALYKGDLLPSCYDDWIIPQREALRQEYLGALERLARLLEEQRDYQAAIRYAQRLLRHDPLHEATYRRLIRLHALDGDRAGALRVYHTCTTVLQRELDVEPSAATREAYEQLLGPESRPSPAVPARTALSPLVGREREWTQMLRAWRAVAAGGEPHVVMLRGEAGIGKTRLAEELHQWASRQGIARASARCYAAEGELAYAPVAAWLRAHPLAPLADVWLAEVARLLPEVLARQPDLPRPVALTEAWQRERLFEALSRAMLAITQPLLLTIDDLQWCDRDTLEWLHFLLRFDRGARLLVVGTYRPEEIGQGHPLASLLQALRLDGQVTEVELGPLDEAATRTLATQLAGDDIDIRIAQLLYRETEGNPLFVVETVRAGLPVQDQGLNAAMVRKLPHDSLPGHVGLPPKVWSVLEARLAQLSSPARELARQAATIGREFRFELLAVASGRDEDTLVRELDELWQRRIVREHGADAYDFSHDKLREVAYRSMSAARRQLLHRRAAQALEALHAPALDPVSHQVAAHYERGGLPGRAAPYYLRAAEVARQVYANEEAIALLQRGLALVADDGPGGGRGERSHEVAAHLWEEMGDVLELMAQHEKALQAYQKAQAQVPHRDRIGQARLHRKGAVAMREQRLYAEALAACHRAEIALGEQPDADDSSWWAEWIEVQVEQVWAHYWLAQWPEMDELVHKVQPVVQECGRAAGRARFLMASCLMHLRRDRYVVSDETLTNSREALAASREWGGLKTRIECQFELGFLHLWRRELDEAEEHLQAALELAETSGIVPLRTLSLTYLTVLSRLRGQMDGVLSHALRAQEAAEAAHMPDYVAAAKGNQAWLAWRRRDLPAAEQRGQEALVIWRQSPLVYPFRWQALWPLVAVALARDREDEAWAHVRALLEPTQQRLPDGLNVPLEAAVRAKAEDQAGAARRHLDRALELARDMGYL